MPLVGLRFSMMQVAAAAAGTQDLVRFRAFRDEALDGNFDFLKPPTGDDTFCEVFCSRVPAKQGKVLEFLSGLGDPQVTHFLAKWCINGSRMNYLARTTLPEFTQTAACDCNKAVVDTIEATCNVVLSDMQRARARFSTEEGVWDCARLLTKPRLLTLLLETPLTSCAPRSDTATEEIKTRVISICKVPSMCWISWCRGWMWLRSTSWIVAGRVASVDNIWMRRGYTAYLAWLVVMLLRSTTWFGTSSSISANALG